MNLKDEKAADLAQVLSEIGEPIVWNGLSLVAIITSIDFSEPLQIGGFGEEYDFTVKIPKAALGGLCPRVNEPIQFDGKTYRISKVSQSPAYPLITLTVHAK